MERACSEKQGALLTAVKEADQDPSSSCANLNATRASLGSTHPSTLTAMNNLASLLQDNGMLEDMEALFRECLQRGGRPRRPRSQHGHVDNNLGMLLHDAGWTMAVGEADEKLLDEATTLLREALGRRDVVDTPTPTPSTPSTTSATAAGSRHGRRRPRCAELNGAAAHRGVAHEKRSARRRTREAAHRRRRGNDAKAITAEYQLGKDAR